MEKTLLPEYFGYKANLHSHSTQSDGRLSPQQLKNYYQKNGYSILAITDHFYMPSRKELNDENFVVLNAYENAVDSSTNGLTCKVYHLNFFSPSIDKIGMVGIRESDFVGWHGKKSKEIIDASPIINGFCDDEYSIKNLNSIIADGNRQGYLVQYNHPAWSMQSAPDYVGLKGLTSMEIFNTGCYREGIEEDNGYIYDQMLRSGQKIFCTANDDNHNGRIDDSFGGYNVMYPDKLNYDGVFKALKNGDFYASTGATIRGVHFVNGKVYVGVENAQYVRLVTGVRYACIQFAKDKPLTQCVFDFPDAPVNYFRIVVKDMFGNKAYTHAYFMEDLLK